MSVPSAAALPTEAPMGAMVRLEDSGATVQRTATSWIPFADVMMGARFVAKGGDDDTGDGSFSNPFLTIQAAIDSISDASASTPSAVFVGPGLFGEAFLAAPWIFVRGSGRGITIISNPSANWLGAGFSVAGVQQGGVSNCTVRTHALTVNFDAVGSPSGVFSFCDAALDAVGFAVTGHALANQIIFENVYQVAAPNQVGTIVNCPAILSNVDLLNTDLSISNTVAFTGVIVIRLDTVSSGRALALNCNDVANFLSVVGHFLSTLSPYLVFVGSGITILGRGLVYSPGFLPDQDVTLSFTTPLTVGAMVCVSRGENWFAMNPTADRLVTINDAGPSTRLVLKNLSSTASITTAGIFVKTIAPGEVLQTWRTDGNGWVTY
jgi:hypothetical protein